MALSARTITAFTKTHAALSAKPGLAAAVLQAWYDQSPEECRLAINGIVADLIAQTAAAQIGFAPTSDIASTTLQTAIEEVLLTAKDAQLGAIVDGTLTSAKLVEALAKAAVASRIHDVGGTATAITATDTDITALYDNMPFNLIVGASNSAAATTLNLNSFGVKSVYKVGTTDSPNFTAGKLVSLWYDAGAGCFFHKASAEGTATAAQVLAPNPFSNETDSGIIGTMVDRSGDNAATDLALSGSTLKFRPPEGYYDGVNDYVTNADADRLASNIKSGVNFDGLTGTYDAKLYASGSANSGAGAQLEVAGLSFTPKYIFVWQSNGNYRYQYYYNADFDPGGTSGINFSDLFFQVDVTSTSPSSSGVSSVAFHDISSSGFHCLVYAANVATYWVAIA
jgi:hypothetical protein